MTLLPYALMSRYRAAPPLRGRRPWMAQATGYGLRPGLDSVSTGGSPRRAIPRGLSPPVRPLPRPPYGTAANDASMMMQSLP